MYLFYEAREYGIRSAIPVSQAYKLYPDAAFLPVNIRLYVQVLDNVMEIMKVFADKFQQYSIDEAFLVPGPEIKDFEEAAIIALKIRKKSRKGKNYLLSRHRAEQNHC